MPCVCVHVCVYTCVKEVDIKFSIYIWRRKSTEYVYIGCIDIFSQDRCTKTILVELCLKQIHAGG